MDKSMHAQPISWEEFNWNHILAGVIVLVIYPFWIIAYHFSDAPSGLGPMLPIGFLLLTAASYWARWRVERKERKRAEQK